MSNFWFIWPLIDRNKSLFLSRILPCTSTVLKVALNVLCIYSFILGLPWSEEYLVQIKYILTPYCKNLFHSFSCCTVKDIWLHHWKNWMHFIAFLVALNSIIVLRSNSAINFLSVWLTGLRMIRKFWKQHS